MPYSRGSVADDGCSRRSTNLHWPLACNLCCPVRFCSLSPSRLLEVSVYLVRIDNSVGGLEFNCLTEGIAIGTIAYVPRNCLLVAVLLRGQEN